MKKALTAILFLSLFIFSVSPAFAAVWSGRYDVTCNEADQVCNLCDLVKVASNIIDLLVQLTFAVGALAIVVGAGMMIFSAGSEQKFSQGKKLITNAVIGIVIAVASWLIINTIFHLITGNPDFPWAELKC